MWTKGLFVFIGPTFSKIPLKLIMRIKEIGHIPTGNKMEDKMGLDGSIILPPKPWSNVNNTDEIHRISKTVKYAWIFELCK